MSLPDKIKKLVKGETPTLLETSKGNELIDAINALANVDIQKGDEDRVDVHADRVEIFYKSKDSAVTQKKIRLIDANNLENAFDITIEDGVVTEINEVDSGIKTRSIQICSNGQVESVSFLVHS